mgnify:CR=1 FL=1
MRYLLALLILALPPAFAEQAAIDEAFSAGQYREAAMQAQVQQTADGLAFAARSLLAEAMSAPDHIPPQDIVVEAETLARQAIEQDGDHIEGRLQLAIALSLRAHPLTTRETMRAGYGGDAKALVEAVLEDDPGNFYAHGFLAVWNIEVVNRGGSIGSAVLGASVKKGRAHYQNAIAVSADDPATHWQYARALTALNARKYREDIDAALKAAVSAPASTALERVMQHRARTLQTALETQKRRDVEDLAAAML